MSGIYVCLKTCRAKITSRESLPSVTSISDSPCSSSELEGLVIHSQGCRSQLETQPLTSGSLQVATLRSIMHGGAPNVGLSKRLPYIESERNGGECLAYLESTAV